MEACSAVDGALNVVISAAAEEVALQLGVEGDLEVIKGEFSVMQAYLRATDEERSQDPVARAWARQVRDVAYDVEDYIEDFAIHLGNSSWWWWCSPSKILKRRRIAAEMKELRCRVDRASKRRKLYGSMASNTPAESTIAPCPDVSMPSGQETASQVMARRAEDLKRSPAIGLSKLLVTQDSSLMVVAICATTTTAATSIGNAYDELAVTEQFRLRAWVTVLHHFNLAEFIRSLLRQFHANAAGAEEQVMEGATIVDVQESIEMMCKTELIRSLARNLQHKKYLLVLDDISTREQWDSIKLYLHQDVDNASRIIVTSKRDDVAKYCAGRLRSTSLCLSDDTEVLPAFCNMDPIADEAAEASCRAGNPENNASTSSEIEELGNNSRAIVAAERIQVRINTRTGSVEEVPRLVGREKEMIWLISKITDAVIENNNVISIFGMRGIGKTALVQSAYHRQDVIDYFTHRAWITVSAFLNKDELVTNVLQHFKSSREGLQDKSMELVKFYEMNKRKQQFRCLVVVDGFSTTTEWDLIKSYLLLEDYKAVLRIIVTTRELQVAGYCSRIDWAYNLSSLDENDASILFRLEVAIAENVELDPDMAEQANQILKKCGGIPFAIVCIGRHLTSRPRTAREWQKSNEHLNLDQLEGDCDLEIMRTTLESCYNSMPYNVKYCFLYLSIFQEDLNITRRRLVKRWIAEGYIRQIRGSEAEEVGERVFSGFLGMTIIQPTKYAAITSGRVTSCSVHPLMLEVSTSKAMEEKLICMLDHHNSPMAPADTVRHVVVRTSWRRDHADEYKSMNLSRVRSLTVFGEWRPFFLSNDMRMLRVLDLEGVEGLTGRELKHIGDFRHLKYLGLRSTRIEQLPKSIGKLQGLETLDIKHTFVKTLPSTIVNLTRLRVLRGGLFSALMGTLPWGVNVPMDIGKLRALNTLGTVSIRLQDQLVVQELKKQTQLQRLSVTGINVHNCQDFSSSLKHLSSLQSLTVRSDDDYSLYLSICWNSLEYPLGRLQVLKLHGPLVPSLPEWIMGLRNLFKLYLCKTRLDVSSNMHVLAYLPNLTTLLLLEDSIVEQQLAFQIDGYQELELLELQNLPGLRFLLFEAGVMPKLKTLQVGCCENLEGMSFQAGATPKLETLQINGCVRLSQRALSGLQHLNLKNVNLNLHAL